jgi:hypothetical protein
MWVNRGQPIRGTIVLLLEIEVSNNDVYFHQARSKNKKRENTKSFIIHHHSSRIITNHDLTKSLENKQTSLTPTCSLILTMASLNNIDCEKITTLIFDVDDTLYDVGNGFTAHRNSDVSTLNPLSSTS